jgi:hypothetical protein
MFWPPQAIFRYKKIKNIKVDLHDPVKNSVRAEACSK